MEHMESNHLLNDVQHSFVPGRSCSTQLLTVLDEWTSALEDGDNLDTSYTVHGLYKSLRHCTTPETPSKYEMLRYWWNCATVDQRIPLWPSPESCSKWK